MRNISLRPLRPSELNTPLRVKGILGVKCLKDYPAVLVWTLYSLVAFDCSSEHGSIAKDSQNTHLPSKTTSAFFGLISHSWPHWLSAPNPLPGIIRRDTGHLWRLQLHHEIAKTRLTPGYGLAHMGLAAVSWQLIRPTFSWSFAHRVKNMCLQSREGVPQVLFPVVALITSRSVCPTIQFTLKLGDFPGCRASAWLIPGRREGHQ